MKRTLFVTLVLCLAFVTVGYAEPFPTVMSEEEIPVWNIGPETLRYSALTSEEEIPVWNNRPETLRYSALTSEEEIPVWNNRPETPRWHPIRISQKE